MKKFRYLLSLVTLSFFFAVTVVAFAQDDTDAAEGENEGAESNGPTPTSPPPSPPVYRGRDKASGMANRAMGAIYELANTARLVIPPGLFIGQRTFTFAAARAHVRPAEIATGFQPIGPTLSFDGAIDATREPVEVTFGVRTLHPVAGKKLVLAMEGPGMCDAVHKTRIAGPLCSTWTTLDARHDENAQRLTATIATPNGYRLQFGWLPEAH